MFNKRYFRVNFEKKLNLLNDETLKLIIGRHVSWYRRHAKIHKHMFRMGSVLLMLINAAIAIMSFANCNFFMGVMSVMVMLIRGIMDLFCFQDNWKRYRSTLENILLEVDKYLAKTNGYRKRDNDFRKRLLVKRVSRITSGELKAWEDLRNNEKKT